MGVHSGWWTTRAWGLGSGAPAFPGGASGEESACQCRRCKRCGLDTQLGRCPGVGNGNPLQCSCLENPMDRGAWLVTIQSDTVRYNWVTKSAHQAPESEQSNVRTRQARSWCSCCWTDISSAPVHLHGHFLPGRLESRQPTPASGSAQWLLGTYMLKQFSEWHSSRKGKAFLVLLHEASHPGMCHLDSHTCRCCAISSILLALLRHDLSVFNASPHHWAVRTEWLPPTLTFFFLWLPQIWTLH